MDGPSADIRSLTRDMRDRVNRRLDQLIGDRDAGVLHEAMRTALLAPGKRLRPLLCLISAECLGGRFEAAIDPACAIEMVHTASLVIDDLPCMDDASMRRGQPACHRRYGSDTAILVGFQLLSRGYEVMSDTADIGDAARLNLVRVLARATGAGGLVGGQQRDLAAVRPDAVPEVDTLRLTRTHEMKTGALFIAAAESGAIVAGLGGDDLIPIRQFAGRIGLAYQTLDDLLDAQGSCAQAGKDVGKDADKPTLVGVLGPAAAREYADDMLAGAMASLQTLGPRMRPLERFVQNELGGHA